MKYTKGPWKFEKAFSDSKYPETLSPSVIHIYHDKEGAPQLEIKQANAQLIAAAPEMYEALKEAHKAMAHLPTDQFELLGGIQIENALAKAEGK